nr:immunoglobulin heavy chain junction region [Macaca mulatta]
CARDPNIAYGDRFDVW